MTHIIGIAGSLRKDSYNAALIRAAAELAPEGCTIELASIKGIPLYDGDLESSDGIPAAVADLKDRIAQADGLILATPEYNNSIPGVMKNALDWLTRPPKDVGRVFRNRPIAVMGTTPGARGTVFSQTAWLQILRALGTRTWFGKQLYVDNAGKVFDDSGKLIDEDLRGRLRDYIEGFVGFIKS